MNSALQLPRERVASVQPEALEAYLLARGWEYDAPASSPSKAVYRYPSEPDAEALVPRRLSLGDYAARVADVLAMVAAVEQRPVWEVLQELSGPRMLPGESGAQTNGANGGPASAPLSEPASGQASS